MPTRIASLLPPLLMSLLLTSLPGHAAEGMWQPRQMPAIAAALGDAGYAGDPAAIADLGRYPMNAVVSIGGCTASFVSPSGLVATNHHCAYGTIQYNSTAQLNLLQLGFLAADHAQELRGDPGLRVYVTEQITNVTKQVRAAVDRAGNSGRTVYEAFEAKSKALVGACEAAGQWRCELYTFHGGQEFNLIRQMEIKDVRLVHAPATAIGKFGGDVDNWMWPRHTGDYAFLRAYVGTDGKPAPYAPDNVPYRPKSWLKVDPTGIKAGDYVMVVGYPGRTNRWRLARELDDAIAITMPMAIAQSRDLLRIIDDTTRERPDAAVKYANTVAGLNNGMKNFQGQLESFGRFDAVAIKRDQEAALQQWLEQRGDPQSVQALVALRSALDEAAARRDRDYRFGSIVPLGVGASVRFNREGSPIAAAMDLYRLALEHEKPDAKREPGYQRRDEVRIRARLEMLERRYDAVTDRALLEQRLRSYAALPAAQRVAELDHWMGISGEQPELSGLATRLDAFYSGLRLTDSQIRLGLIGASRRKIQASDDTALALAVALYPAVERIEAQSKAAIGNDLLQRPRYMQAMIDFQASLGQAVFADANGTLRVTYGNVVGYSPRDAVSYAPFTTLAGVAHKSTGIAPFDSPASLLTAITQASGAKYRASELGDVPVNFLADLDITGGNSGSPTLNARGELVGLAFDGNWESVSSNWIFNPALTRSIHVDIRYMLWVMDQVDHAQRLMVEMGLAQAASPAP